MTRLALGARGISVCRGCGLPGLASVLDLGEQPLSNEMGRASGEELDRFPLHLRICRSCGLGQLGEFVLPRRIFGDDYPYLSSTSTSWVEHARQYAGSQVDQLGLGEDDLVVEIASNDGYLLSAFQAEGVRVLGIEPARNVAPLAIDRGVPTVNDFFGLALAERLVAEHGHPRLIVANNVMAHVPDLEDFTRGLATLAGPDTVITVENPSLVNLINETQFDTIYHEHFSYLTAHAVRVVVQRCGLELFRVQRLRTHGGSNRYWVRRSVGADVDPSVESVVDSELSSGLLDEAAWEQFAFASRSAIDGLRSWLAGQRERGAKVAAYGAAAKGNTLLNAAGSTTDDIAYAVDASAEKQGRFLPGTGIPVFAPLRLSDDRPDHVVILPWNLAGEITPLVSVLAPDAAVWRAVPAMTRLA